MFNKFVFVISLFGAISLADFAHDAASRRSLIIAYKACPSNNIHEVSTDDTCQTIAANASVSTGDLQALNSLNTQCTDLKLNSTICLPGACTTYLVQAGDTCATIASAHNNMTISAFYSINPTINSTDCSNLLFGTNVCLTQPAEPPIDISTYPAKNATSSNGTVSTTGTSVPGTGATACSKSYKAQTGDICKGIAASNDISVAWFEAQNPSINAGCTNLEAGRSYCVAPEPSGPAASSAASATVTPLAPGGHRYKRSW